MTDTVVPIGTSTKFSAPQPVDIREAWNIVRDGIQEILSQNPQLTFLPEDVYSECVNERATLFMSPIGFLVLSSEIDQFTGNKTLLIWIAYTYEQGKHNWIDHYKWFDQVARALGCSFIEARSSVPEMEEYALANGWQLDTRVYTREVINDGK